MSNIIAVIWDCDKTLINGYMQDPIFDEYKINAAEFWNENNKQIEELKKAYPDIRVNSDTHYLNLFLEYIRSGRMTGLNNEKLRAFGKQQCFYNNVPEFLAEIKGLFRDNKEYNEYGIQVENYIVSTGFAEVIRGSSLANIVEGIWGCELIETKNETGELVLSDVVYTIDNTTKTRAIFEINKGVTSNSDDVNRKIDINLRRVPFENMIYIADGPSDIPAFSLVKQKGGTTFAIYPKGKKDLLNQVEQLRIDGRVDMYAEADYTKDTTAYLWVISKIESIAKRIRDREKMKLSSSSNLPKHIL